LAEAEQTAIQDAIRLNELLTQRVSLIEDAARAEKDFQQQLFDLQTQDSIERRQSGAVKTGLAIAKLREDNEARKKAAAERLADIDREIRLTSARVAKERQVFQISTDINALHRRDEELQLSAVDTLIQRWLDLKGIVASIVPTPGGGFEFQPNAAQATPAPQTATQRQRVV